MSRKTFQNEVKIRIAAEDTSSPTFDAFTRKLNGLKSALNELGGVLGSLGIGLSVASLAAGLKSVADDLDRVSKSAQKVGLSVEGLSALEYAAGQSGIEVAGLEANLSKLNKTAVEAAQGSREPAEAFAALEVSVSDAGGAVKKADVLLLDLAAAFARFEDGPQKAELAMRLFGRAGADMIPMLNAGREGITVLMDEARSLGVVMDTDAAKAAENFNDNLDRLSKSLRGLAIVAGQEAIPALSDITDAMVLAAKEGGVLKAAWVGLGGIADQVINGTQLGNLRDRAKELEATVSEMRAVVEKGAAPIPFSPFEIRFNEATMAKYKASLAKAEAELKEIHGRIEAILNPPKADKPQSAFALDQVQVSAESLNAELKKLGIDPKQFEQPATDVINTFKRIAGTATATGDQILMALVAGLDKVSNESAPNMAASLAKAFNDGRVSAAQLEVGMSAITTKAEGLWAAMDAGAAQAGALEAAYKTLGITSQEALNAAAMKAKEAFELIQANGASVGVLSAAWGKYAEAAIAANGGVADATINAQAAMHRYAIEVDTAGKAHVQAMGAALAATNALAAGEKARQDAMNKVNDSKISELEKADPAAADAEQQRQAQEAIRAADLANAHATVNGLHGYKEADKYRAESAAQSQRATDLAGQFKDTAAAEQVLAAIGTIAGQAASAQDKSQELAGYRAGGKVPDAIPMNAQVKMVNINLSYGGKTAPVQVPEGAETAVVDLFSQLQRDMGRS